MNGQYDPIRDLREVPPLGFVAKHEGRCAVCTQPIAAGQRIRRVPGLPRNGACYAHADCR